MFGGAAFDGFDAGAFTDHYVKLRLPDREGAIRTRTYTVRQWDGEAELTVDFVVHGDTGVAGPWAAAAQPGDEVSSAGPGGAYTPDPDADWHLLAGDASVIPAIAASLPRIPAGVPVHVVLEVDGPEEEQPLVRPATSSCTWLHRRAPGEEPTAAERRGARAPARPRPRVRARRGELRARAPPPPDRRPRPDRATLSISGYWKLKRTEEGWREDKAEWARLVEADLVAAAKVAPRKRQTDAKPRTIGCAA